MYKNFILILKKFNEIKKYYLKLLKIINNDKISKKIKYKLE